MASSSMPSDAVRRADGQVVVPESRRADGSVRKAIRIRAGYVPQEEVPRYKIVAQRRREQEAKEVDSVDAISLSGLSLSDRNARSAGSERKPRADDVGLWKRSVPPPRSPRRQAQREPREQPHDAKPKPKEQQQASSLREDKAVEKKAELKTELSKINKLLKEIDKLEAKLKDQEKEHEPTSQEKRKLARRPELHDKRNAILAELNGATVSQTTASGSGGRKFCAISL